MKEEANIKAADTIAGDLVGALIAEFRLLPDIWAKVGHDEQKEIIARIQKRVMDNVREAVRLIAAEDRITVAGELKRVTFADKVEAVFTLGKRDPRAMDLCHAQGLACLIVVADASAHMGGTDKPHGDIRQGDLLDETNGTRDASSIIEQVRRRTQPPAPPADPLDTDGE